MTQGRTRCLGPVSIAALAIAVAGVWLRAGPLPTGLLELSQYDSTTVLDRNGEVLYEARAGDGSRAEWLTPDRLPAPLVDATVAAEDRRFWRHPGIDAIALARATIRNLRGRRVVEGGSTITQQVAKLLLARLDGANRSRGLVSKCVAQGFSPAFGLRQAQAVVSLSPFDVAPGDPEALEGSNHAALKGCATNDFETHSKDSRSLMAKAREAVVALRLEHRVTKREILALYLNLAPYGNQITGAERASREYFGHGTTLLTPAQAAFLAALPQRPSWFNPYRDARRARQRQERVIIEMGLAGSLTPDAVRQALDERLSLQREPAAFIAPHFVERVLAKGGSNRPHAIATTLDAELQRTIQGIIRSERSALDRAGARNVAVVVLDNISGEWLAWEGSGNYGDGSHGGAIDGVMTPRQPGSALKPFTYALAFEDGESPATVLPDVPSYFATGEEGVLYSPRNYDNRFRGPLLARSALAGSVNVPAVALASRIGAPNVLRFLRGAGFTTFDKTASYYGLGVTLGDAEVRLDQLVAAYAAFARGGLTVQPTFVRSGADVVARQSARLVSARTAFWITDILSDDQAREFAFGRGGSLEFPFKVAAKTGTSQGYHDNWAVGFTRAVTVGVWVGNFDQRPLVASSGVSGAGPIFHAVMMAAEQRASGGATHGEETATVAEPENTNRRRICALSGMAAGPWCPAQTDEWTALEAPPHDCTWHRVTPRGIVVQWPAEYEPWARAERLVDRATPLPAATHTVAAMTIRSQPAEIRAPLRIVSPPDGAVYLIDPTLRRDFQTLPLRATAPGRAVVEWHVDDQVVARGEAASSVDWPLIPGRHTINVRDGSGHAADVAIVVK